MTTRREFLKTSLALTTSLAASAIVAPALLRASEDQPASGKLTIGMITDVHQDIMHDATERITAFVDDMNTKRADLVLNLGDFCVPKPANQPFLDAWNKFAGPRFHVLGNHDMDGGYKREQTVEFYKMPARYYSFDHSGIHFVVLDANDPDGKTKGYQRYIAADQLKWLADDLAQTKLPTLIAVHQPFDAFDKACTNAADIRAVLKQANDAAGFRKVMAVFSGHIHADYLLETDGIAYIQLNSASYVWVNKPHKSYSDEIHAEHKYLSHVCPYEKPLWATVTINFDQGLIELTGRESKWVGATPWDLGLSEATYGYSREHCRPAITERKLKLPS